MGYRKIARDMSDGSRRIVLIIWIVLYILISIVTSGSSIRRFESIGGDTVYATIKSSSVVRDTYRSGGRRRSRYKLIAQVEYTYNGEVHTAKVNKPFTKGVGDSLKLGITSDGRIFLLERYFDLTFVVFSIIIFVVGVVFIMRKNEEKERIKQQKLEPDDFVWQPPKNTFGDGSSDMQLQKRIASEQTKNEMDAKMANEKNEEEEVIKLKFELKKPLEEGKSREQEEWRP